MQDRLRNQAHILDQDKIGASKIIVIGAGAIGSFLTMTLCKMGAKNVTVYDDDTVEDHNFANQMFPIGAIGMKKVEALKRICLEYGENVIEEKDFRWHPDHAADGDIIAVCVDNMDVRKAIWDHYKDRGVGLFLEGRMSAQVWRVYGIDPKNEDARRLYETNLYPQSEAAPERCGEKSIIYTVLSVGSEMLAQIKRHLMAEHRPTEVIYDALRADITKKYNMEEQYEKIEVPELAEEAVPA